MEYSISPDGERFALPTEDDNIKEYDRLKELVEARREEGFEIVVVMGLGFVGAVMAGVVADSVDKKTGKSNKLLFAKTRRSGYWLPIHFTRLIIPLLSMCWNLRSGIYH